MTSAITPRARRLEHGFGLVETMVGLTAGLVLVGVLAYFYLAGTQVSRTHNDLSRMQESGRMALETLGREIRQAGARTTVFAAAPVALTAAEGTNGGPDSITVSYAAPNTNTAAGGEVDCVGTAIPAGNPVTETFTVDATIAALTCTTPANIAAGGTPVVVEENVENIQLTYGVDTSSPKDGTIESYQTADNVADFGQVAAVSVALLVRGPSARGAANGGSSVAYNGGVVAADGRLRQVFSATFSVRNQTP